MYFTYNLYSTNQIRSDRTIGVRGNYSNQEVPLLNWNFIIQNSGVFQKEYSVRSQNNMSQRKTDLTVHYQRTDGMTVVNRNGPKQYNQTLQIHGEIQVK